MQFLKRVVPAQYSQQKSVPDLHGVTVAFLALKKSFFWKKKNSSQKKKFFFYLFSMQLLSADAIMFSIFHFFFFFYHEKLKKTPKKLLRISPDPFFPRSSPGHSPQPKIDLIKKFRDQTFSAYFLLFPYPKKFSQLFSSHWKK